MQVTNTNPETVVATPFLGQNDEYRQYSGSTRTVLVQYSGSIRGHTNLLHNGKTYSKKYTKKNHNIVL